MKEVKVGTEVVLKDGARVEVSQGRAGEFFLTVIGKGIVYGGVDYDTPNGLAEYLTEQ